MKTSQRKNIRTVGVIVLASILMSCDSSPEIDYTVVSDTNYSARHAAKRSVVVRLPREASEIELRQVATELKNIEVRDFERTFIEYYQPGMKINAGAWATTHFDPELDIRLY